MKKQKILVMISGILFPGIVTLLIISLHSKMLIKTWMQIVLMIFLVVTVSILIWNLVKIIKEKRIVKKLLPILFGIYIIGCCSFLFLLYGPIETFRNWLVTTAMGTMNHQYFCQWFYSEDEIQKVLSENYTLEPEDDTDSSLIDFEGTREYANEYEEKLFKNLQDDELYRIIEFKVNGCNAYLAAVYDPSKISVAITKNYPEYGEYVTTMAEKRKAPLAINGGGFVDPNHSSSGGVPLGVSISKGEIFTGKEGRSRVIGFDKDNKLVLLSNKTAQEALDMGIRDAVNHAPFLIVNGKASFVKGSGGWGLAARTAIGQRSDGVVLLLVIDSNATRTKGADMGDLVEIMQNYGAINAANLDGGTSSVMVENYKVINNPIDSTLANKTRPIASAFVVEN